MLKHIFPILLALLTCLPVQSQTEDAISAGTKHRLHSDILGEDREYWISLPESYTAEGADYKKYPVLIVLDGPAHFRHITGTVNYMSAGYNGNRRIPEMIVVAISNVNRRRDFTPDKVITVRENDSGGGEHFLSFLEQELIPELDRQYRTAPYRILFGHSLGGLLVSHAYLKKETLFNAFIAVDPSFGAWDAETMDEKLAQTDDSVFKRYLYIATANWGKRNIRNRDRHVRFYEALNSKCAGSFLAKQEYFPDENHGSVPPIAFYKGISAIFAGYGPYYRDINNTEQLIHHYQRLSDRLSWDIPPPEALVNRVAYYLLRSRDEKDQWKALDFFILNTTNYPRSYQAFNHLGAAYTSTGDSEKALQAYQQSLALHPGNTNAKARIQELKTKAVKN